jgi:hypothetical protein
MSHQVPVRGVRAFPSAPIGRGGENRGWAYPSGVAASQCCNEHAAFASGCGPYLVRMIHGKKARPIQKDGTLQRFLLGGLGPAPTVGQPWGDPPGASTCNEHAAFASGCGPYLVRMIHGKKARPIQKDGTLQRLLLGGLGPAPTVGQPWVDPPGASTCNDMRLSPRAAART